MLWLRGALNFIGAGVEVRGGDVRLNADNTFVNTPPQLQLLMASLLGKYSRKWQSLSELHDAVSVAGSNWAPGLRSADKHHRDGFHGTLL